MGTLERGLVIRLFQPDDGPEKKIRLGKVKTQEESR